MERTQDTGLIVHGDRGSDLTKVILLSMSPVNGGKVKYRVLDHQIQIRLQFAPI